MVHATCAPITHHSKLSILFRFTSELLQKSLHIAFVKSYMERGLFQFAYGSKDSLVEFLHGDNFVQAHLRAAEAIQKPNSLVVSKMLWLESLPTL